MGRKQKAMEVRHPSSDVGDKLFFLRTKYSLLGKAEWWWLMDDSLAEIGARLESEHVVVIDGFLTGAHTRSLRDEIRDAHEHGHLAPGVLAGGKAGDSTQYTMRDVRGDHVGWFDGSERLEGVEWDTLPIAMKRADTLVNQLGAQPRSELATVSSRSKAMCTVYPGDDARYVRHVDNPDGNGRLLTALLYLNPEWEEGNGGELRVFRCLSGSGEAAAAGFVDCDGKSLESADRFDTRVKSDDLGATDEIVAVDARDVAEGVRDVATLRGGGENGETKPVRLTDVAPLGGRLVLFKSDARVPHEVLAARAPRYAVTLWYFDKSEVTAARAAPLSEAEREEQEEKIAREIKFMRLKHGVTSEPEVRIRDSQEGEWRDTGTTRPTPDVPGQCSAAWEDGDVIAITVPLPAGTCAADCGVEVDTSSSTLIIEAPGLEGDVARVKLPEGADEDSIAVKLSKKPTRALVVRVRCEPLAVPPTPTPHTVESPPPEPAPDLPPRTSVPATSAAKDCVGVGGTLSWSSSTDFSTLPSVPPREPGTAPRGIDLRDASDWEDFIQPRWALAGKEDEKPVLTPHALDGLSFPVTLAWSLQQPGVSEALAEKTRKKTRTDAMFANLGDETAGTTPVVVVIAGASSFTEQHLLDRTRYWEEVTVAAPQPAGGIHLAFVGPDVAGGIHLAFVGPDVAAASAAVRRLSPTITASVHRETVRDYTARVPNDVPLMIVGFNTGMGGGGSALARGWAPDLVETLRRTDAPAVFTAANDYADLRGELAVFKALGARFIVNPRTNPFRAFTHTIGEGEGEPGVWSCANAFVYAVRGFAEGKGPSAGLTDEQLCTLAAKAAERAAGAAWDALGMRRS